jgi:protein-tyrosine-phosphatase
VSLRDANFAKLVGSGHRALLMTRFSSEKKYKTLEKAVRDVLYAYGIKAVRADDRFSAPTLWESLKNDMDGCSFGIAILDEKANSGINPNVLVEIEYMLARNASLLLLKDRKLKRLPSDILGHLYREFDADHMEETTKRAVLEWLRDQGVAKREGEKLVVFVTQGGTCRCAMSKAILLQSLRGRTLPFDLSVMSLAARYGEARGASSGARDIVKAAFAEDILEHHQVRKLYPALCKEADLILCAEATLKQGFPEEKTTTIAEFFGGSGDIVNPWPSNGSAQAALRYKRSFEQLRELIMPRGDNVIAYLSGTLNILKKPSAKRQRTTGQRHHQNGTVLGGRHRGTGRPMTR